MSRKLEDLIPILAIKAIELSKNANEQGINILITDTWRSFAEQQALYDLGRTKPGRIITWAKPGQSFHNYGLAFDFVPMNEGKPDWKSLDKFQLVGEMGEDLGLEWGGRWPRKKDMPHLQMSFGLSVDELFTLFRTGGIQRVWQECNKKYEQGLWP
uniref:Putative peptidase n=1 Tax=viral metagenome TaxID=1070528 RepID=A0A6H1Z898_9ZZZZ